MSNSEDRPGNKTALWTGVVFAAAMVIAGTVVWGFVQHRGEAADKADQERPSDALTRVVVESGPKLITIEPAAQVRNGIETVRLSLALFHTEVRAYGTVLDLATLTDLNNKYANAKSQLQTAQAKLTASKSAFERAQHLYQQQQVVSLAQFQTAESAFRIDSAAVAAAQSQVRTLSATAYQEWGSVLGKSLIDGSPLVTRLIEREEYLLQVTLPPRVSLAKAPANGRVEFDQRTSAPINYISPATRTDPKIQGISYFYAAKATSGLLPGMNVLAFLPSDQPVKGVRVPGSAVDWWQSRAWAYRRVDSDHFERLPISTNLPAPGGGYLVTSLSQTIDLVTRGAQLFLSEEFRTQAKPDED